MAKKQKEAALIRILPIMTFFVAICLVVYLICFSVVTFVKYKNSELVTEVAVKETVYEKIETKCFVLRDESFIKSNADGTIVSFADNGQRIAAGDTVSIVFDSKDDAAAYLKMNEIKSDIESFEKIAGQSDIDVSNIDSLNKKINNELFAYLDNIDSALYSDALKDSANYSATVTTKQIAIGKKMDVSEKLDALRNTLAEYEKQNFNFNKITAKSSGYFIEGVDGYEQTFDFNNIDNISIKDIENALESEAGSSPGGVIGRSVGSFKWYILCVVDKADTVALSFTKDYYLNFPYNGIERLPVKLSKMIEEDGDRVGLVFSCDLMNEELADLRIESVEIITDEYTGLRIPNSAIRTNDGVKGVYIVRGHLMGFRKIKMVYAGEEYSLVEKPEKADSGFIRLYDVVVKEGVDLHDDKLV